MKASLLLPLGIVLLSAVPFSQATDHFVAPNGSAAWSQCTNINTPCFLGTANQNAQAGDTVYLRGGIYTFSGFSGGINPTNSGTSSGNMITFSAYNGEEVDFVGSSANWQGCVHLQNGQNYIKVYGIDCINWTLHLQLWDASHNEISHCSFIGFPSVPTSWDASELQSNGGSGSNYNWIHDCAFGNYGYFDPNDNGAIIDIGWDNGLDPSSYNLIENNTFYHGGHHVVGLHGNHNVFRNNYVHNDAWSNYNGSLYGNRVLYMMGTTDAGRNLVEGNRIAYGSGSPDDDPSGDGLAIFSPNNIIRKNMVYQNAVSGYFSYKYADPRLPPSYNKVYNNVFWYNGHDRSQTWKTVNWQEVYSHGGCMQDDANCQQNVFKNNIWYQNLNTLGAAIDLIDYQKQVPSWQIIANEWNGGVYGDPKFVNIIGTPDPMDENQFDFHLQSSSPCINNGGFLTNITSLSGSGTQFQVADAGYFFDGWGIGSAITGANVVGDTIQLQGQTATATISNVNYTTNTITFTPSLTWTNGQGISLAYEGSAPDIGTYEYTNSSTSQNCSQISGTCCSANQTCSGSFQSSSDCATCCTGGRCQACLHKSDTNCDGCVDMTELSAFIVRWLMNNQDVTIRELIEAIGLYKKGCSG